MTEPSSNAWDFSDLKAVTLNCTLKRSPEKSHTAGLMQVSENILRGQGVEISHIRVVDHPVAQGIYPDMRNHGWAEDAWPELWKKVLAADIVLVGTPIWLGQLSGVCKLLIDRLYAMSGEHNSKGQYIYYGKVGGCVVTGNEDGVKHCAMEILYSLQHLGITIPPQADAGWIGEAGPGPSYLDEGSGGLENEFTQRNTTFMTWNLMHFARLLKDAGGIPAHGNLRTGWDLGERYGYANPEYR
ncbi:MAG: flavodoxin family protein [Alphaproteobacteria bacterium]